MEEKAQIIQAFYRNHKRMPTYSEICELFDYKSKNAASKLVTKLARYGVLEKDKKGRFFWDTFKRKSGKQYYRIVCPDGSILDNDEYGNPISWLRSESRFKSDLEQGEIKFEKREKSWSVMFKQRMPKGKKPRSLIMNKGTTGDGSSEVLTLFERNILGL